MQQYAPSPSKGTVYVTADCYYDMLIYKYIRKGDEFSPNSFAS